MPQRSNDSFNLGPGRPNFKLGMEELSSMWETAGSAGEFLERILQKITNPPNQDDFVPSAPEQMGQHYGGSNTEQGRQQNNSFWQPGGSDQVFIVLDSALGFKLIATSPDLTHPQDEQ